MNWLGPRGGIPALDGCVAPFGTPAAAAAGSVRGTAAEAAGLVAPPGTPPDGVGSTSARDFLFL